MKSNLSAGLIKPIHLRGRYLPMSMICLIISSLISLSSLVDADPVKPSIRIVNTTELLSLIKSTDDTVRLFNFWATWCKPCVRELPYFDELNNTRKKEKFQLYLVSLDFRDDYKKRLLPFLKKKNISSPVLLFDGGNPNDWIDRIHPEWSGSIPASLIAYKGQKCFEENEFHSLDELINFYNNCKSHFEL